MNKKRVFATIVSVFLLVVGVWCFRAMRLRPVPLPDPREGICFFILSDAGAMGNEMQHRVARTMDSIAAIMQPRMVISSGDLFHGGGIRTFADSALWQQNFKQVYDLPHLQVEWYGVLGNHEYYGLPDTLVALSHIDARWQMSARYYDRSFASVDSSVRFKILFADSSPYKRSYRQKEGYREVLKVDPQQETHWMDSVLRVADEPLKIVVGHHSMYTADWGHGNTYELIAAWRPLFVKYGVQAYFSGHVHNFEHLVRGGVNYFRTSAGGADTRAAYPFYGTRFSNARNGFTLCQATSSAIRVYFISDSGEVLYSAEIAYPPSCEETP